MIFTIKPITLGLVTNSSTMIFPTNYNDEQLVIDLLRAFGVKTELCKIYKPSTGDLIEYVTARHSDIFGMLFAITYNKGERELYDVLFDRAIAYYLDAYSFLVGGVFIDIDTSQNPEIPQEYSDKLPEYLLVKCRDHNITYTDLLEHLFGDFATYNG